MKVKTKEATGPAVVPEPELVIPAGVESVCETRRSDVIHGLRDRIKLISSQLATWPADAAVRTEFYLMQRAGLESALSDAEAEIDRVTRLSGRALVERFHPAYLEELARESAGQAQVSMDRWQVQAQLEVEQRRRRGVTSDPADRIVMFGGTA